MEFNPGNNPLTDQEQVRHEQLHKLREMGIEPFPGASFEVNTFAETILKEFPFEPEKFTSVSLAGRMVNRRIMGKASFLELQDSTGRIQCYINRDSICPEEDKTLYNEVFKHLLSTGDFVGVQGYVFTTQTGETTIHVSSFQILSKALRPIPFGKEKEGQHFDTFSDTEQRYRMRYVDLVVNPHVKEVFVKRTKLVNTIRGILNEIGCLEVETPILQPIYGGAAARPFKTHHNTLDMPLYLRIANELYLKRLIVGGFDGVYEFAKDFRNEGMSRFHNPEFTQVELYVAYKDYYWMMDLVEEMFEKIAVALNGSTEVQSGNNLINFQRPWKRYTMYEAISAFTGTDISEMDEPTMRAFAEGLGIETDESMGRAKLIDEIFGEKVEPLLIQPTIIMDYPVEMSPLAKKHRNKPGLVERFEAICNGKEVCNAFSELNDPIDQRARFEEQLELGRRGDPEAMVLDEDFLRALEFGMPPTVGLGVGIDRLTMIMTNSPSIQDVLFFPQMRPEAPIAVAAKENFSIAGVPEEWSALLAQVGIDNLAALGNANPNKLFNDLCGLNKKKKLGLQNPEKSNVQSWVLNAQQGNSSNRTEV